MMSVMLNACWAGKRGCGATYSGSKGPQDVESWSGFRMAEGNFCLLEIVLIGNTTVERRDGLDVLSMQWTLSRCFLSLALLFALQSQSGTQHDVRGPCFSATCRCLCSFRPNLTLQLESGHLNLRLMFAWRLPVLAMTLSSGSRRSGRVRTLQEHI